MEEMLEKDGERWVNDRKIDERNMEETCLFLENMKRYGETMNVVLNVQYMVSSLKNKTWERWVKKREKRWKKYGEEKGERMGNIGKVWKKYG